MAPLEQHGGYPVGNAQSTSHAEDLLNCSVLGCSTLYTVGDHKHTYVCTNYILTVKRETAAFSQLLITIYQTTRLHTVEGTVRSHNFYISPTNLHCCMLPCISCQNLGMKPTITLHLCNNPNNLYLPLLKYLHINVKNTVY